MLMKLYFYHKPEHGMFHEITAPEHNELVDRVEDLISSDEGVVVASFRPPEHIDKIDSVFDSERPYRLLTAFDNVDQFITWVEWLINHKSNAEYSPRTKEVILYHFPYRYDIKRCYGQTYFEVKARLLSIIKRYDPEINLDNFIQKLSDYDISIIPIDQGYGITGFYSVYSPEKIVQEMNEKTQEEPNDV